MTSEKNLILDLITKIENPEVQREYLLKLKDSLIDQEKPSNNKSHKEAYSLNKILFEKPREQHKTTIEDLQEEIRQIKEEVRNLQMEQEIIKIKLEKNDEASTSQPVAQENEAIDSFISSISKINFQKWYAYVTIVIKYYTIKVKALIDSGADQNFIQEGLVPTKYFEKTTERLYTANNKRLQINYKLSKAHICNQGVCFPNTFLLIKDLSRSVILGTSFLTQIYPLTVSSLGITTTIFDKDITFEFVEQVKDKEIRLVQSQINKTQIKVI